MSNFSPLIERNRAFAEALGAGQVPVIPRLMTFVIACLDPRVEPAAGMRDEAIEEQPAEVFEAEALVEYRRLFERRAGRDRLERLQEAAVLREFEIFGDRPRACVRRQPAGDVVVPEAQGRAEHRARLGGRRERHEFGQAAGLAQRDDGVGGAEI